MVQRELGQKLEPGSVIAVLLGNCHTLPVQGGQHLSHLTKYAGRY